jgi:hypothetical protein
MYAPFKKGDEVSHFSVPKPRLHFVYLSNRISHHVLRRRYSRKQRQPSAVAKLNIGIPLPDFFNLPLGGLEVQCTYYEYYCCKL